MDFGKSDMFENFAASKGKLDKSKGEKMAFSKGQKEKVIIDSLAKKDKKVLGEFMKKEKSIKKQKSFKRPKQSAAAISPKNRAARAGLHFPVARIHSKLKTLVPARARVGGTAAVFMAAVLEYLVAELCELAGNRAKASSKRDPEESDKKRRARITPRYIQFAIHEDAEFASLLQKTWLTGGGVVPLDDKKLKQQISNYKNKKLGYSAPNQALQDQDDYFYDDE